jgi:hypothetical protein
MCTGGIDMRPGTMTSTPSIIFGFRLRGFDFIAAAMELPNGSESP